MTKLVLLEEDISENKRNITKNLQSFKISGIDNRTQTNWFLSRNIAELVQNTRPVK